MSRKGLLTLVVTPRQAARATLAAFGKCYRDSKGNLYRDRADDWFEPVGLLKIAQKQTSPVGGEAQVSKEGDSMSVVSNAIEKVKSLFASDDPSVVEFRRCKALVAEKATVREKLADTHRRLEECRIACRRGLVEFEGHLPASRLKELDGQATILADKMFAITDAQSRMVGICPCDDLQSERRKINLLRQQINKAIDSIKQRIDSTLADLKKCQVNFDKLEKSGGTNRREADDLQREIKTLRQIVTEFEEERAELLADRAANDNARAECYKKMLAVEV